MGIRLDWQVESEAGSEDVAEDTAMLAAQQRKRIRVRRLILVLTPMLIAISVVVWWRLRVSETAREEALIAVVEAEMLALRVGDSTKFLQLQAAADDWRRHQSANFTAFQEHVPPITVTGEIVESDVQGPEARVSVRVLIGEVQEVAVWLYAYSAEKGWQHVSTEAEPWARASLNGTGYRIEYYPDDEDLARQVDLMIRDWWEAATRRTGIDHPLPLIVIIDPYSKTLGWADRTHTRLSIPSELQVDGLLEPETRRSLRLILADQWAWYVLGYPELKPHNAWVLTETTQWIDDGFAYGQGNQPTAEVFFALSGAFGNRFLPTFFAAMRADAPNVRDALHESMTAHGPYAGRTDGLQRYLSYALRAEIAFHNEYEITDWNANVGPAPLTRDLFMFEGRSMWSRAAGGKLPYEGASSESVEILAVQHDTNDFLWVTAEMLADGAPITVRVPFIFRDGYWVHTWAVERDWGSYYLMSNPAVTLQYHNLDVPYITTELLNELGEISEQAAVDFGIPPRPVHVYVGPGEADVLALRADSVLVRADSVYQDVWLPADTPASEYYRQALGAEIIAALYTTTQPAGYEWLAPMDFGIMQWEMRHLGVDGHYKSRPTRQDTPYRPSYVESLFVAWPVGGSAEWEYAIGAEVLVEMLIERYGIEMLPAMIANLYTGDNQDAGDDWLFSTFGIRTSHIEADWLERYYQRLAEYDQP